MTPALAYTLLGWLLLALGIGCHLRGAWLREQAQAAAHQAWLDGSPEARAFREPDYFCTRAKEEKS